ncbi:MAG: hypothetical protein ACRYE8_04200 [Janthinobacterium lividum]
MLFPLEACPAWIPNRHCERALLRGSFSPCHPVIYSRDPVKNTNKISIFYYFLDLVPKPRYDYLRVFFNPRWQCRINHGMTEKT